MNYSKRQLYALGEPLGDSATRSKLGGGRIYGGGGGGGFIQDIGNSISDAVSSVSDALASIDPGPAIGSGLASIDQTVRDVIPGGWVTVGAAALMAVGIANPGLLAAADAGTLTSAELAAEGFDAATVAADVSSAAADAGFTDVATFNAAADAGFTNAAEYSAATQAGFTDAASFNAATNAGFADAATFDAASNAGITNIAEYNSALEAGGFTDPATFNTALNGGFTDAATFNEATSAGFNSAAQFENATTLGYTNAQEYAAGQLGNFADAAEYQQAAGLGYTNASDFSAGELGGYANANDFTTASNLGYANNAQYQVGLEHGFANANDLMTSMTDAGFSSPETYGQALDAGFGASGSAGAADWLTAQQAGISDYATYAGAVAAGLILPQILSPLVPGSQGGGITFGYAGESPWTWGSQPMPTNPGVNPGWLAGNVTPHYQTTSPDQAQYYWGQHPALTSANNVGQQWNNVPNAPATPFGEATSAVGGTQHLDINQFVHNMLTNPTYAASASGTTPGTVSTPGTPFVPVAAPPAPAPALTPPALPTTPVGATPIMPPQGPTISEQVPPVDVTGPAIPVSIPLDTTQYGDQVPVNGAISPVIA